MEPNPVQETVTRLLTTANLNRMRGKLEEAVAACQQAVDLAPNDPSAHELLGDLLVAQNKLPEGMEHYKHAFDLAAKPATEEKIARLALRIDAEKYLGVPAAEVPAGPRRRLNPSWACGLSLLFPGLGQLYNGEHIKGALLFGGGVILLLGNLLTAAPNARALQAAFMGSARGMAAPPLPPSFWLFSVLLTGVWLYGMLDAPIRAAALNRGEQPGGKSGWEV